MEQSQEFQRKNDLWSKAKNLGQFSEEKEAVTELGLKFRPECPETVTCRKNYVWKFILFFFT